MKKLESGSQKRLFLALSFLFPFLGYVAVMIFSGFTPFGNSSNLYSDTYHQYYPFFVEFRRSLRAGESLIYNWNLGMGADYLALIAYYLASPLNLLSVVVPENWLLPYFSMLFPVKLGMAGLFFGIFLMKTFDKADWSVPVFSACYGLCAWALGYQWNIMWLDTFTLLPLVILGMVALLQRRRFVLYTVTLFFSIACNYYIGFFTCIFVGLCFICYEICYWRSLKRFFADLSLMFFFSALAISMTAFLELPAFLGLQNTYSSVNKFPTKFDLNITEDTWRGLIDGMRQVAGNAVGGITPTFKEGLPNLYCGILPLILAIQFFTTRKFTLREKFCNLFLLVFFLLSVLIRQLDYIWHGFHFTNMIPYRFTFLFSFVVLVMAYRSYLLLEQCPPWRTILSGLLFVGLAACSNDRTKPVFLIFNLVFLIIYMALLLSRKRAKVVVTETSDGLTAGFAAPATQEHTAWNQRVSLLLLGALALEMVCALVNFGANFTGTIISNYPRGLADTEAVMEHMKQREKNTIFYRTEFTHTQSLNDDALNGVSGITMFSSSANVRTTKFMAALGYGAKPSYNRYSFEESSPVANAFLNLKYLICRDGKLLDSSVYDQVYNMGDVYLLENNAYLPLGFMTRESMKSLSVDEIEAGSFDFQNRLFTAATGIAHPVFAQAMEYTAAHTGQELSISQRQNSGYCSYTSGSAAGEVSISFVVPEDGFVCVDLMASKRNKLTIYKNNTEVLSETMSLDQMLAVGDCKAGDVVEVSFDCKTNEEGRLEVVGAVLRDPIFRQGLALLAEETLELTELSGTRVTGTVSVLEKSLLYTSIPYEDNWIATVDGQEAAIVVLCDSMVGLELEPGTHTVTFTYRNSAFLHGSILSGVALSLFLLITLLAYHPRKRGKFESGRRG